AAWRIYSPEARQWSLNFANSSVGTLSVPTVGEFRNGRGEFYDQETLGARTILVRNIFSDITPTSYRFEQESSDDGGKTWEVNWIAVDTRTNERAAAAHCGVHAVDAARNPPFRLGGSDVARIFPVRLIDFSIRRPPHEIDQRRALDWIAEAHAAAEERDPDDRAQLAGRLRRALGRYGCGPERIRRRRHFARDVGSTDFRDAAL